MGHGDEGKRRGRSRDLRGPFSRLVKYLINPLLALSDVARAMISRGVWLPSCRIDLRPGRKKESLMNEKRLIKNEVTGNGRVPRAASCQRCTDRARFYVSPTAGSQRECLTNAVSADLKAVSLQVHRL